MNLVLISFISIICCSQQLFAEPMVSEDSSFKKSKAIIVEIRLDPVESKDSISLGLSSVEVFGLGYEFKPVKQEVRDGNVKWKFPTEVPLLINNISTKFLENQSALWVLEPGDSIVVALKDKTTVFTGKGSEKLKVQYEIAELQRNMKRPTNPSPYVTRSLSDYMEWDKYLNEQQMLSIRVLDTYKDKISSFSYKYIKSMIIEEIQYSRINKFSKLRVIAKESKVENKRLSDIFDAGFYGEPAKWMRSLPLGFGGSVIFISTEVLSKYNFNLEHDSIDTKDKRNKLYYEQGSKTYKGLTREFFLVNLLTYSCIKKTGFTPNTEMLLAKYYAEPGYPEHKNFVKEIELKARKLRNGSPTPDFSLTDAKGNIFNKDKVKNKVVLMDFWFTGCAGCVQMAQMLRQVENTFRSDTNVVFLSISTDKDRDKWLRSIAKEKYVMGEGINLYTGGQGVEHSIVKAYNVNAFPGLYLFNPEGNIVINPVPDPRMDSGAKLTEIIKRELTLQRDGPYVIEEGSDRRAYYINGEAVYSEKIKIKDRKILTVQSDEHNKMFEIVLKEDLATEPSEFERPERLFVLSDIEGNFGAFRKLLQANNIIDSNYNWIFGNGHLVINGDVFDRGEQVTACLWLIYSLEEKAQQAGGYVHFILGNHEIMNLSGDDRYVRERYKRSATFLARSYTDLYRKDTELGNWLRTKNVIEKIGDLLFVHAGISKEFNDLAFPIEKINKLARPFYDREDEAKESMDKTLALLFNSKRSPFWYREYYLDQPTKIKIGGNRSDTLYKPDEKIIDDVLTSFDVKHIVTGHTLVNEGDKVSVHYNNKVINTDTRHAAGKSEALMITDNKYFRADLSGKKFLLFEKPD